MAVVLLLSECVQRVAISSVGMVFMHRAGAHTHTHNIDQDKSSAVNNIKNMFNGDENKGGDRLEFMLKSCETFIVALLSLSLSLFFSLSLSFTPSLTLSLSLSLSLSPVLDF